MSVHEQPWADGTPCWAELSVPDLGLGRQFYGGLLGWEWEVGPEETGFYSQGVVGGRHTAALSAPVALWEAGTSVGAQVVDEPGAMIWNEHMSADPAAARAFYGSVVGWTYTDMSAPGFDYTTAEADGRTVGGIGGPAERPEWAVYFAVTDTDAAAAAAVRLGGAVSSEPQDTEYGRLAGISGPFGERFWLMSTDEPSSPPAG